MGSDDQPVRQREEAGSEGEAERFERGGQAEGGIDWEKVLLTRRLDRLLDMVVIFVRSLP